MMTQLTRINRYSNTCCRPGIEKILKKITLGICVFSFMLPAIPGLADDYNAARQNLEDLEQEITDQKKQQQTLSQKDQSISQETANLRAQLIQTARQAQNLEDVVSGLDAELLRLEDQVMNAQSRLADRRQQINASMALLQRIALRPAIAAYFSSDNATDAADAAAFMARMIPELNDEIGEIVADLLELKTARTLLKNRRETRAQATQNLKNERHRLNTLLADKNRLQADISKDRQAIDQRIATLSSQAQSLRDLVTALTEKNPNGKNQPSSRPTTDQNVTSYLKDPELAYLNTLAFSQAKGQLLPPARGEIIRRYGESTGPTTTSKGVSILTADNAHIVAPFAGEILYAGKFRDYGHLLIISHGEGYHGLIAGLERIDAQVGQQLLAGEPVGVMGNAGNGFNTLYFEIRRSGKSVNPLPWLAVSAGIKTSSLYPGN